MKRKVPWILDGAQKGKFEGTSTPKNLIGVIDYDYLDKLSDADLQWLASFSDSYYTGAKKAEFADLPKAKVLESYERNNKRVRDLYNNFGIIGLDTEELESLAVEVKEDPALSDADELFEAAFLDLIKDKLSTRLGTREEFIDRMSEVLHIIRCLCKAHH